MMKEKYFHQARPQLHIIQLRFTSSKKAE
jgi:hypothetical protein